MTIRPSIKELEQRIKDLENELEQESENLMAANRALKAALDHRDTEKRSIETTMLEGIRMHVLPYLEIIEESKPHSDSKIYIEIIKKNLDNFIGRSTNTLCSAYMDLTPKEIQVADLIRQGKTSKEISLSLNISNSSISFYRYNIRKKMGLLNKKTNLRTHLISLSK